MSILKNSDCCVQGCHIKCYNHLDLLPHLNWHLNNRKFECGYVNCQKSFINSHFLHIHRLCHSNKYEIDCGLCGNSLSYCDFWNHTKTHVAVYNCEFPECGIWFNTSDQLHHHVQEHENREHMCSSCGSCLERLEQYQNHRKTHDDGFQYQCKLIYCQRSFETSNEVMVHFIKHFDPTF